MNGQSFRRRVGFSAAGALLLALVLPVTTASAATSAKAATTPQTVTVPATQPWTDTHISLSKGTVSFKRASGTINVSSGNPDFTNTPAGKGPADPNCIASPNTKWGGGWIVMGLPCWSLIGKIGNNGTPFEVGKGITNHPVSNPGELYLGVNDQSDSFVDNSGSWKVQVSWTSGKPNEGTPAAQDPRLKFVNGCTLSPDRQPGIYDFTSACNHHDVCYARYPDGHHQYGDGEKGRAICDKMFHEEMYRLCTAQHPGTSFIEGVRRGSCQAWSNA
jgi:hypothetical protein